MWSCLASVIDMMGLLIGYTYFVFLHHHHDLHPPQHRFALVIGFWAQRRVVLSCRHKSCVVDRHYGVKVGIFRCQVRTHPPSDGLHFIVMGANQLPNKGPAPELTLSQIFGFEHEDIPNSGLNFVSMPEDFNMQNSQPPYSSPFGGPQQLLKTKLSNSVILCSRQYVRSKKLELLIVIFRYGQKHKTHDDDQLVARYQVVLGATFEDLFNTCQHLPSGPAEEFTRPTNSNDFGLGDQDGHLFTGRPNQQPPLSEELSWFPEKYLAELNLPFETDGPAVQTSQLPYSVHSSSSWHNAWRPIITNKAPLEISHSLITSSILSIICFILVFEGYISKPESPNPQLPTSSAEFYCENNTMVAQGLSCPGGNIDYLWNRNKPFPSEKEHLVESPEKLTWIGDFGFVAVIVFNLNLSAPAQELSWSPGNIFVELELPPVHEDPGLPNLQLPGSVEALNSYQVMEKSTEQNTLSIAELHDFLKRNIPSSCEDVYFQYHTQVAQGLRSAGEFTPLPSVGDHCNQTVSPHLVETSYASLNSPLINNGNSNGADLGLPLQCKRAKLCSKGKDERRPYNKFRLDERDELTEGVQKYAGMYCCWIKIKDEYFKNDPHRTPDNLKHMMERDPSLKKLYKRALIANKNAKFKSPKCKQGRILKNI
ncbi:unnamed protein product [Camellia sinensis]